MGIGSVSVGFYVTDDNAELTSYEKKNIFEVLKLAFLPEEYTHAVLSESKDFWQQNGSYVEMDILCKISNQWVHLYSTNT